MSSQYSDIFRYQFFTKKKAVKNHLESVSSLILHNFTTKNHEKPLGISFLYANGNATPCVARSFSSASPGLTSARRSVGMTG